jgi:hypothetical protein
MCSQADDPSQHDPRRHKITFHPGDWWGEKGCATCGKPLKIVSIWSRDWHFWAHEDRR